MALYKEQDMQEYWRNRIARERRDISKSVEETLADAASQEDLLDDVYEDEPPGANTSLVPPRLSLQSKLLSAVRSETFVQSVTAELAAQKKTGEEQQKSQNPGILARFAQQVTSSIAAIGSALQPVTPDIPPPPEELFSVEESQRMSKQIYLESPREVQRKPSTAIIDAIPSISSPIPTALPVRSKQRLAGHTAKIRLQTASAPKSTPRPEEQEWNADSQNPIREPLTVNVRFREKAQKPSSSNAILAITPYEEKNALTSGSETNCVSFFGSGAFESGQGELMVRNVRTTATSVVHVTLTSKPGPTLVQYVSLHPEVGFTLHLTAPVTTRTTFNYALFVDTSDS
jgi:hypothetical protein